MKNLMFISIFLIFFVLSSGLVRSEGIEIIVPNEPVAVYTGQTNELEILIKNDRNVKDTFYFSTSATTQWISLKNSWASLGTGEVTSLSLVIEPPIDTEEGTSILSITVRSVDYNVSASKQVYFSVKRSSPVFITEIKLNKQSLKPGETLVIQPVLTNVDKNQRMDVFVTTKILKDDYLVQSFDNSISIGPSKIETVSNNFVIKLTHTPGNYNIFSSVKDNLNKLLSQKTTTFKIEQLPRRINEEKEITNSVFYSNTVIRVTNNGNVPERNFNVLVSLPTISKKFFHPEVEPTSQEEKDNKIIYKWFISELSPGETITIKYQLQFTNLIIASSILIIVIVWILWLFYQPKLMKKYMGLLSKDEQITISLHVKNKSRKLLDTVTVKDFVPAIATVIKEFGTIEPTIKIKPGGTELTWQVKNIRPKEERVLTYKIKPMIEILGSLKLPKAHLMFETKKGKIKKTLSKTITIMGKVK
ncbi:MAG: hypothetical protein NTW30_00330 [Candidatus Aenigmarchaeota archaeon]|nr:hypothetical protein [Candidatus Aenigmarchaeota archaeon]